MLPRAPSAASRESRVGDRSGTGTSGAPRKRHAASRRGQMLDANLRIIVSTKWWPGQRRSASAASYIRTYAARAGATSFVVLKAAMTADVVTGLKKRNDRNPAWLPVWPRMVALPRCTTKNESAIESGVAAVSLIGWSGRHMLARVALKITTS